MLSMNTNRLVVQIDSESYPGKHCYIQWNGEVWSRHTRIASSFESRAAAIMTVEKLRCELAKLESETTASFVKRLRYARFVPADEVEDDVFIRPFIVQ